MMRKKPGNLRISRFYDITHETGHARHTCWYTEKMLNKLDPTFFISIT